MQNLRCDAFFLAQNPQKKVFSADMPVIETFGLFGRISKNSFTFVRKRQVDRGGDFFPDGRSAFDFLSNALNGRRISKKTIGQILIFPNQPKQKMLSLDRRTSELAGLIASEKDHS